MRFVGCTITVKFNAKAFAYIFLSVTQGQDLNLPESSAQFVCACFTGA